MGSTLLRGNDLELKRLKVPRPLLRLLELNLDFSIGREVRLVDHARHNPHRALRLKAIFVAGNVHKCDLLGDAHLLPRLQDRTIVAIHFEPRQEPAANVAGTAVRASCRPPPL